MKKITKSYTFGCDPSGRWFRKKECVIDKINLTELAKRPGVPSFFREGTKIPTRQAIIEESDRLATSVVKNDKEYKIYKKITKLRMLSDSKWSIYGGVSKNGTVVYLSTKFNSLITNKEFWGKLGDFSTKTKAKVCVIKDSNETNVVVSSAKRKTVELIWNIQKLSYEQVINKIDKMDNLMLSIFEAN